MFIYFPLFHCRFFFKQNKTKEIYIFTCLFFIFWKLEISEQFIKFISRITDFAFHRTVDFTDLIALSILPISYYYFHKKNEEQKENNNNNFALNSLIGVITIYSFLADTNPRQEAKVKLKSTKEFTLQIGKKQILNDLITSETNILETDSLFAINFDVPEYRATATAKIRIIKADEKKTIFKIDSITEVLVIGRLFFGISQSNIDSCEKMNASEYEENFKTNCIDLITNVRKTEYPTYYAFKTE